MASSSRKTYTISGIVQGVGYRYFASVAARRLEILGFAKNLPGGQVEVLAEGETVALAAFRRELERGPASSRVDAVTESEPEFREPFIAFNIL